MDHLTLRNAPQEIDVDEVLRSYGLEDAVEDATVVQDGNNIITIPSGGANTTSSDSPLEPPPIDEIEIHTVSVDVGADEGDTQLVTVLRGDSVVQSILAADMSALRTQVEAEHLAEEETETENSPEESSIPEGILDTEDALDFLIPVNSKSAEVDKVTSRFSGAVWYDAIRKSNVVLAGLGGIGSYVLFCLSRMQPTQIFLYDDDNVESENLSGQLYSTSMVGRKKVNAMAQLARDFSNYNGVISVPRKFTRDTAAGDIMICGFDNMEARQTFFNVWLNHVIRHNNPEKCLYIDGRLDMEEFQVFCIRGDDSFNIKRYSKEYLFSEWMAQSVACSRKQTTYCANMIGSVIVNLFTNFISNTLNPEIERELPFKTYYNASLMYFKTES